MEKAVSLPNDKIAIIVEKNDNRNNTFYLIPVSVVIGKVDARGYFVSEDGSQEFPPMDNPKYLLDSNIEKGYAFIDCIDNIRATYTGIEDIAMLEYSYLRDIASKMNIALASEDKVHIYSADYKNISPHISGDTLKKYQEETTPEEQIEELPVEMIINHADDEISQQELEDFLKARILGNDELLEDIATTVVLNQTAIDKSEVEAILGVGPTGSGKTATFEAIAEFLGIPLTIFDCNQLTAEGYIGKDLDDVMRKIYLNCECDKKKAERSILVLDEIDKIAMRGNDVKDSSVQYALLKLLDGYEYTFDKKKNGPQVTLDSSFLTIACLGAFPDMYKKHEPTRTMGFGSTPTINDSTSEYIFTTDDFVDAGMLREFIGRCQNIVQFKKLTKDDLKQIILHSKNSIFLRKIQRYQRQFGIETIYDDAFIDYLVECAFIQNTGGRSINKIISRTFKKIDRDLLRTQNKPIETRPKKLVLTKDLVENNHSYNI